MTVPGIPDISVIMAVYNGEQYLEAALGSIREQTFSNFEFIIIDDGSSDGTRSILGRHAQSDPRIRLVHQENVGLTRSLISCASMARAHYIARMDADDISLPSRLEKQLHFLDRHPDVGLVSSGIEFMNVDGSKRFDHLPMDFPFACTKFFMPFFNVMAGHGQVMFRKPIYVAAGGYDGAFRFAQDYDLWERMAKITRFAKIDEVLYRFRTSPDSITKNNWSGQQECRSRVSTRAYMELTGQPLSGDLLHIVNEFWHDRGDTRFERNDFRAIDRVMRTAFSAWLEDGQTTEARLVIGQKVAEQLLERSNKIPIRSFTTLVTCIALALRWRPASMRTAARMAIRRILRA